MQNYDMTFLQFLLRRNSMIAVTIVGNKEVWIKLLITNIFIIKKIIAAQ